MSKKVVIIGANGATAKHVIEFLKDNPDIELTLFARNSSRLAAYSTIGNIVEGDAMNLSQLEEVIKGKDIVYVNVDGKIDIITANVIQAMENQHVQRIISVNALGIYDEIPGKFGEFTWKMVGHDLPIYRKAADVLEASSLDYTIVRPSWLSDKDETDYETTQKGEAFIGTEVSRKAVAAYVTDLILHPKKDIHASVGINKPGVYVDKPSFY
ncbi:MAG TPA: NAD-dependent dehydratase [Flavobacteriaceae bacterium]|nr:NAD-dependent dehydratase [Flavobacteriaceae bacterium]